MNRRGFLGMLSGIVLSEAIPLNRVWSFPKEIKIVPVATISEYFDYVTVTDLMLDTAIDPLVPYRITV